jgi:hypothetical protein
VIELEVRHVKGRFLTHENTADEEIAAAQQLYAVVGLLAASGLTEFSLASMRADGAA